MDLIILYIVLAVGSGVFFWLKGPFWTNYDDVDPNAKKSINSFPGTWKKGAEFKYDPGFKEYVAKGGNTTFWKTKHQTKFNKPKSKTRKK